MCEGAGWRITAEIVDHGSRLDFPDAFRQRWVCLGYRFECPQGVIAFSGDTVDCPGLRRLAANADILVQCCYLARSEIASPQTQRLADYTLACADTVGRIATEAKVGTLVLTHHRPKSASCWRRCARMWHAISPDQCCWDTTGCASRCNSAVIMLRRTINGCANGLDRCANSLLSSPQFVPNRSTTHEQEPDR